MIARTLLEPAAVHAAARALSAVDSPYTVAAVRRLHDLGAHERDGGSLVATEADYDAAVAAVEDLVMDVVNGDAPAACRHGVIVARNALRSACVSA